MKKISLIAGLLFTILLLQNCKNDVVTATAQSTKLYAAVINDTTFTPRADSINTAVTYNSSAKNKVFSCTGTFNNRQINLAIILPNTNTTGFPLGNYIIDATSKVALSYLKQQKNSSGVYVLTQQGTVSPGSGGISITAIDSVKKQVTGIFSFTSLIKHLDVNGNITSTLLNQISAGQFNNLSYTFKAN
jgi:hypothetical protein